MNIHNNNEKFQEYIKKYKHVPDVLIIAGGPSQQTFDFNRLNPSKQQLIICCNQSFRQTPYAQIAHHSDYAWWQQHQNELKHGFHGDIISGCGLGCNHTYPKQEVTNLKTIHFATQDRLFKSPNYVYGNNCGLQALSLAHLFLPKRIWLLGYDFQASQEQTHAYRPMHEFDLAHYQKFWALFLKDFQRFETLRHKQWANTHHEEVLPKIYNLNPDSGLKLYPSPLQLPTWLQSS